MKSKFLALLLALIAAGTLGCGDSNDFDEVSGQQGNPIPGGGGNTQEAFLRVAHLSADAGSVDVLVNGTVVLSDVEFETISDYLEVPAGSTRVEVRATGGTTDVIDQTVNLAADGYYTAAVTGSADGTGSNALGLLLLNDNVVPTANTVRVRFINAVPGGGTLTLTDEAGNPIAGPQAFNTASSYLAFTQALGSDSVQLRDENGNIVAIYDTVRGGNQNIFDALSQAVSGTGTNITVIAGGNGDNIQPGIIVIDNGAEGSESFVTDPAAVQEV